VRASASRLRAAGAKLDGDQRFAAIAAGALLATMFLPWYEKSVLVPRKVEDTISAFGAVSFVEAAVFLVSAGVLVLVLARAEGGRFHLPGGDGMVILAAGLWAAALIFYRVFDRPDVSGDGAGASVGIQWGFFVAFVAAGALALAGQRMRATARPELPPRVRRSRRDRSGEEDPDDIAWSDAPTQIVRSGPPRTRLPAASEQDAPAEDAGTDPPQGPRDRSVTRADAEQLDVADPPEAPPRRERS
jgi:hypothetical protein